MGWVGWYAWLNIKQPLIKQIFSWKLNKNDFDFFVFDLFIHTDQKASKNYNFKNDKLGFALVFSSVNIR